MRSDAPACRRRRKPRPPTVSDTPLVTALRRALAREKDPATRIWLKRLIEVK